MAPRKRMQSVRVPQMGRRKKGKTRAKRAGRARGAAGVSPRWRWWLLRGVLLYLAFNLGLNILLAFTRPMDFDRIFELGHLDSRSEAALLLARHCLWHSSWAEEQSIDSLTVEAAQAAGLEVSLLRALVEAESGGKPHAISDVGACGLTQLMPSTARELDIRDPFDPRENLFGGARYLARLHHRFRGNLSWTLAAYNAGPGAVLKAGGVPPFRETQRYVSRISQRYRILLAQER